MMAFRLFCKSTCIVESTVACLTVLLWPCVPPSAPCPPEAPRTPFCRAILGRPPTQSAASPTSTAPWPLAMLHIFPQGTCRPRRPQGSPSPGHRAHAVPLPQFVVNDGEKRPRHQCRRREACALELSVASDHGKCQYRYIYMRKHPQPVCRGH
jgi:hypothetical protein